MRMSANTVRKYVCELEERQLISTESSTVTTRDGMKRNGNLLYTIRPIQVALDQFYEQKLAQMRVAAERDSLCAAVWPLCYPEGNKPALIANKAVSKACGLCAPSSEFSTAESGR